jgi:bacterioferritin (cytochrome b1)
MTIAEFVNLINDDLRNEWTHLNFYLYHASAVCGLHAHEYKEFLTDAAKGEMQHVQQFLDRLFGLDYAKPTLEGKTFPVFQKVDDALMYALAMERDVVKTYAERIAQAETLPDPVGKYLSVFYEDQMQDSYEDAEHIQRLLKTL